jgi:hypothetical protein
MAKEKSLLEAFMEKHPHLYTEDGERCFKKGAATMMGFVNDSRQLLRKGKIQDAIKKLEDAWQEYMRCL